MSAGLFKVYFKHRTLSSRWGNLALAVCPVAFGLGTFAQAQPCDPERLFGPALSYPVSSISASTIVSADFNGDGVPDVATESRISERSIAVLLGDGSGGFGPETLFPTNQLWPWSISLGDLNNDGFVDIVVGNNGGGDFAVLLGNGDGTFQPAINTPVGFPVVSDTALADFDGDGVLDLVVCDVDNNRVWLLYGNGDGTFFGATPIPAGDFPTRVSVGDVDGDGNLDLIVGNFLSNDVSVIRRHASGLFFDQVRFPVDIRPGRPVLVDVNGDGVLDIVVSHNNDNGSISVLLGIDGLTYQPRVSYAVGNTPGIVRVGDFTGDGVLDLAVTNLRDDDVSILVGIGDGTFAPQVRFPVNDGPYDLVPTDTNGNGALDFVVGHRNDLNIRVLLNTCVPGLAFATPPQDAIAEPGGRAVFTASVRGPLPIAFQWLFNGRPIDGADGPELVIESVRPGDMGLYSLEISANGDTLRSPPARLAVFNACPGDFDGDGTLTIFDFLAFQNAFAAGCP